MDKARKQRLDNIELHLAASKQESHGKSQLDLLRRTSQLISESRDDSEIKYIKNWKP